MWDSPQSLRSTGVVSGYSRSNERYVVGTLTFPIAATVLLVLVVSVPRGSGGGERNERQEKRTNTVIDFNRDIRPILSNNCFSCHGPDEHSREAKLRLDQAEGVLGLASDARSVVVPGSPEQSVLLERISASDPATRMPPPETGKSLSPIQIRMIREWIAEGALLGKFWSFEPVVRPGLPTSGIGAWQQTGLDPFVLDALKPRQLSPSTEASREAILRRVTLDLIGLPPKLPEMELFLADHQPDAYDRVVDRLLSSPHYGERMALEWLDAARYADTYGYFSDLERTMWPWRNWVIEAFNANLGFDQFTIEQLAGDLLPSPTERQLIATGFHRNQPVTDETGIIEEEYRTEYVADRVDTTATIWLGLTVACARCHDHKFDPLTQRDYYQLFAFFNQGPETGLVRGTLAPPTLTVPSDDQKTQTEKLRLHRQECEREYSTHEAGLNASLAQWESTVETTLSSPSSNGLVSHLEFDDGAIDVQTQRSAVLHGNVRYVEGMIGQALDLYGGEHLELSNQFLPRDNSPWAISLWFRTDSRYSIGCLLSKVRADGDRRGIEILTKKRAVVINLINHWGSNGIEATVRDSFPAGKWHQLVVAYDGSRRAEGLRVYVNGLQRELRVDSDALTGPIESDEPWRIGRRDTNLGYFGQIDDLRFYSRMLDSSEVFAAHQGVVLRRILAKPSDKRASEEKEQLFAAFVASIPSSPAVAAWNEMRRARAAEKKHLESIPTVLVTKENEQPRNTFVLVRGRYDQPGDKVVADVPATLLPMPVRYPRNRLGLAQWLMDPQNPLTPRVTANRIWKQLFGEGIVRSVNDFGSQGEPPSHPELLDYLAAELVNSSWNFKRQLRSVVLSATYRQSSGRDLNLQQLDPDNRLLARGPRFRLTGETIRDQALAASGLLVSSIGGPSVKPYQPAGLWESVSYDADQSYVQDVGPGLYRRSLYTYWKRQIPPPILATFDSPTRETCVVQRSRTNTPLQALVTLNDPTFVEAARTLASSLVQDGRGPESIIDAAFGWLLGRRPDSAETAELLSLYYDRRAEFRDNPPSASALMSVGHSPPPRGETHVDVAAWTLVVSAIMNLDEAVTKR